MFWKDLVDLGSQAAEGQDNIKEGAIEFAQYGFVFKDVEYIKNHVNIRGTSGFTWLGTNLALKEDWEAGNIKNAEDYLNYDQDYDILLISAVKTLVPTMTFSKGNVIDEALFNVWIFIQTPDQKRFPATLHYRKGKLVLSGYDHKFFGEDLKIPKEFEEIINFDPFDLLPKELEELTEALELALQKTPKTDFVGKIWDDWGIWEIGVKSRKPFLEVAARKDEVIINPKESMAGMEIYDEFIKIQCKYPSPEKLSLKESIRARTIAALDELIEYAHKFDSRLVYQVLGSILIKNEIKIGKDLKKILLDNSRWTDERQNYIKKNDKFERKKYLHDFRAKILSL